MSTNTNWGPGSCIHTHLVELGHGAERVVPSLTQFADEEAALLRRMTFTAHLAHLQWSRQRVSGNQLAAVCLHATCTLQLAQRQQPRMRAAAISSSGTLAPVQKVW